MTTLNTEEIHQVIAEIESVDNKLRKRREWIAAQVDEGNLYWYVQEEIKKMYPQTWAAYTISEFSLSKKIYDKKSKSYKEAPRRKLSSDLETEEYTDILWRNKFNHRMRKADRYYHRHKHFLLTVFPDETKEDKWHFHPLPAYMYDCVFNDDGTLKVVVLSYPDRTVRLGPNTDGLDSLIAESGDTDEGNESTVYTLWTDTQCMKVRVKKAKGTKHVIELLSQERNADNVNPYGVLPFVFAPELDESNYPVQSPLASQVINLNALNSIYLTSSNMQIGQLVLKYPEGKDIQYVTQGLMTAIKLPQSTNPDDPDTDANYISPSPNLSGHREGVISYMTMILQEQGIENTQVVDAGTQQFSSGFDRLLANADVQGIIEDTQQNVFQDVEQQVYSLVKTIYENYFKRSKFSDEFIDVTFEKPKILISDSDKLSNLKQMIELGLIEEHEKFTIVDPNLSEEEAMEKLERIEAKKMEKAQAFLGPLNVANNNQEVDDADNEESSLEEN